MIIIDKLKYFLGGIVFIAFLYPVVESLISVILTILEIFKTKLAINIADINESLEDSEEMPLAPAMGFSIPTDDEVPEDE